MPQGSITDLNSTVITPTNAFESVSLRSHTKDSLLIQWRVRERWLPLVEGFKLDYQALGSSVIEYSHRLEANRGQYDITQLHENTNYKVCVTVYANASQTEKCLRASTTTNSLTVALGSTFGAFLALGIIVFFVFFAKWQNTRKLRRHLKQMAAMGEKTGEHDMELSDISLRVHDDDEDDRECKLSQTSGQSKPHTNGSIATDSDIARTLNGDVGTPPAESSKLLGKEETKGPPQIHDVKLKPGNPAYKTQIGGEQTQALLQPPPGSLRPNLSCNW